jgi:iron complex outermembrane receptor protein
LTGLFVLCGCVPLFAQLPEEETEPEQKPTPVDTLRVIKIGDRYQPIDDTTTIYHLGAVVVGTRIRPIQRSNTLQRVPLASINHVDASRVSELGRLIPSGYVQTNSRGESLLYMRNTGERQTALFFDGAQLNVPWDNRVDLDLIPASVVENMTVSKGASSVAYGANVMGGAVNMISRSLNKPGAVTELDLQRGSGGLFEGSLVQLGRSESFEYTLAGGYVSRDGLPLSDDADLPFNQLDSSVRTNTDLKRWNLFGRGAYEFKGGVKASLTASVIDARKGIAPEGHKDPETSSSIRYWRYPDWTNVMLIGSVGAERSSRRQTGFRVSGWLNRFGQSIVSYESIQYDVVDEEQDDDDVTIGTRAVVRHGIGRSEVQISANGSYTRHDQTERNLDNSIDQSFAQLLGSGGLEFDIRPEGSVWYSVSLNADVQSVTDADAFESPDPSVDVGGAVGAIVQAGRDWTVRTSIGRKTRFPTMRERYSGALGRFVVNPDLTSEKAVLGEVGAAYSSGASSVEFVAFANLTTDTIDQDVVEVGGEIKRIRVNLGGSRSYGLEANLTLEPMENLTIVANGMLNYLRAQDAESGEYDRRMTERPSTLASFMASYTHPSGLLGSGSVVHTGVAYSLDDTGEFVQLASATTLNLRAGYRFSPAGPSSAIELFGRANNVFDVLIENQLGLPGPGRLLQVGVKMGV